MSLVNTKTTIRTIEGCFNISKFLKKQFEDQNLSNIKFINNDFANAIDYLDETTFDFVFFDGNHQKEATLNYFEMLLPKAHNDTVFVFDDIYWSKGMAEAWETIKLHPKVTVTIDTFFWGFVFFRKEQEKEHFMIRT
jgi:predicted O-methyltransferase YrrM